MSRSISNRLPFPFLAIQLFGLSETSVTETANAMANSLVARTALQLTVFIRADPNKLKLLYEWI